MYSRLLMFCLALLAFGASWAAEVIPLCSEKTSKSKPSTRFVTASSATMRDGPTVSSKVRTYLPIATPVQVSCEDAGWLHAWAPTFMGAVGWVRTDLTGEDEPTLQGMLQQLASTPLGNRSLVNQLAERVIALGPLDEGAHEAVIRSLEAADDQAGAERIRRRLSGLRSPEVKRASDEPQIIFVADGDLISPLAIFSDGKLTSYPEPDENDDEKTQNIIHSFSNRYFATGRAYHFYTRAGADGLALVRRKEEPSCASVVASFMRVPNSMQKSVGGILTNFPLTQRKAKPSTPLTTDQRRQMVNLISSVLKVNHVNNKHMALIMDMSDAHSALNIDVAPLSGNPFPVLIAISDVEILPDASSAEQSYRGYNLRVIAEADKGGHYRITHQEFNQTDSEQTFSPRHFITYLDLDMDGNDELIFSGSGYEWWWYEALGKKNGSWNELVRGGGGGC